MRHRRAFWAASAVAVVLTASACSTGIDQSAPASSSPPAPRETPTTKPSPDPTPTESTAPAVAGLQPGEMPPVPLIVLPDLSIVNTATSGAAPSVKESVGTYPGLTVNTTTCDASGGVVTGTDTMLVYGDGTGVYTGPDGSVVNDGDGGGVLSLNGVEAVLDGMGGGTFNDGTISIVNGGDGSGVYDDGTLSVVIDGEGGGTWQRGEEQIVVEADGSGTYNDGTVSIVNNGDGTGVYDDGTISIVNDGEGTALVNGVDIPAEPLPPVPPAGKFPPLGAMAPMESCGVTITLDTGVLFDFDKSTLRPEAGEVLDAVASALADLNATSMEISGHTDSISDEAYNHTLSEARAEAVAAVLADRGVAATITTVGYGETRPVAPNELNGQDNPAGRQLNRRVEFFIPAV